MAIGFRLMKEEKSLLKTCPIMLNTSKRPVSALIPSGLQKGLVSNGFYLGSASMYRY